MARRITIENEGHEEKYLSVTDDRLNVDAEISTSVLPAGASTSAKQLPDDHNVTVTDIEGGTIDEVTNVPLVDEVAIAKIYGKTGNATFQVPRIDTSTHSFQTIEYEHHEVHSGSSYFTEGHTTLGDGDPDPVNFYASFQTPDNAKWGHFVWSVTSSGILDIKVYEGSSGGMANGLRGVIHANNRNINCWSGSHTGAADQATVMTDSTQSWTINELVDMQIYNQTDGSSGFITANTANTVTVAALAGGTGNDWDLGDVYEINNSQMIVNVNHDAPTTLGLLFGDTAFGGTGFKADVGGGTQRANELVAMQNKLYVIHIASGSEGNIVTFSLHWYEHEDKSA